MHDIFVQFAIPVSYCIIVADQSVINNTTVNKIICWHLWLFAAHSCLGAISSCSQQVLWCLASLQRSAACNYIIKYAEWGRSRPGLIRSSLPHSVTPPQSACQARDWVIYETLQTNTGGVFGVIICMQPRIRDDFMSHSIIARQGAASIALRPPL